MPLAKRWSHRAGGRHHGVEPPRTGGHPVVSSTPPGRGWPGRGEDVDDIRREVALRERGTGRPPDGALAGSYKMPTARCRWRLARCSGDPARRRMAATELAGDRPLLLQSVVGRSFGAVRVRHHVDDVIAKPTSGIRVDTPSIRASNLHVMGTLRVLPRCIYQCHVDHLHCSTRFQGTAYIVLLGVQFSTKDSFFGLGDGTHRIASPLRPQHPQPAPRG